MDSLNTIPNSGSFGDVSAKLNDNFSKVGQSLTTLENVAIANKGYFDTLASLQAAFPSPKAGNTAYVANVASSTGYYIYNVVSGVWTATTTEAPAVGVAISNYAQHGYSSSPKTLKQVDDEVVQLAGDVVDNNQQIVIASLNASYNNIKLSGNSVIFKKKGFSVLYKGVRYNFVGTSDLSINFTTDKSRQYVYIDTTKLISTGNINWNDTEVIKQSVETYPIGNILLCASYFGNIELTGAAATTIIKSELDNKSKSSKIIASSYCGVGDRQDFVLVDTNAQNITFPPQFTVIRTNSSDKISIVSSEVVSLISTYWDGSVYAGSSLGYLVARNKPVSGQPMIMHINHNLWTIDYENDWTIFGIVKRNTPDISVTDDVEIMAIFPYKINGIRGNEKETRLQWQSQRISFNNYSDTTLYVEEDVINSNLYIKAPVDGQTYAMFARGLSFSSEWTWQQFKDKVVLDDPTFIFSDSQNGVADCLRLAHNECLSYNFMLQKFRKVNPSTRTNEDYVIAHCDYGKVGLLTKDLAVKTKSINSFLERNKMANIIEPLVKNYIKGVNLNNEVYDRFSILHITDVHYNSQNSDKNLAEVINFSKKFPLSVIICSGDVCNGQYDKDKSIAISEISSFRNRALTSNIPICTTIGNHDDNINRASIGGGSTLEFANALTKEEQYQNLISPFSEKYPLIQSQINKCYFYLDIASRNVRIIVLDFVDVPVVNAGDGRLKYRNCYYYSQSQLNWLYDTLNSTPNDYGVILVNHGPAVAGYEVGAYSQGNSLIYDIVNAWKNGESFNHSYVDSAFAELSTSKVFDFTARGVGEFITHLAGHTHSLSFIHPDNYEDQQIIVGANLFTGALVNTWGAKIAYMHRDNSEDLRSSFNVISIDRILRKIFITTHGAYIDCNGNNSSRVKILDY